MAENKTKPTAVSPEEYIADVEKDWQREDALWLMDMMQRVVGAPAKMWGPSIIGFGQYHYKYESGREGDGSLAGFSPRKGNTVVYLGGEIPDQAELLKKLGPHKMGRACLYLKELDTIDRDILEELVTKSMKATQAKYPDSA